MKLTNDNFWLFISIGLFVIIVGTAYIYAFRPFDAKAVSQDNPNTATSSQTSTPASGQSGGCGI
jgi:hypothetical protein